jgi:hypothetical protein
VRSKAYLPCFTGLLVVECLMLQPRLWADLDGGDFGWLKAKHHFSASEQGNPNHGPLGWLTVWNDDEIAPGMGFQQIWLRPRGAGAKPVKAT